MITPRINVKIRYADNRRVQYLNNKILDLMNREKFGGEFRMGGGKKNEEIILNSMPAHLLEWLRSQKIKYRVISPKDKPKNEVIFSMDKTNQNKIGNMFKKAGKVIKSVPARFMAFLKNLG